MSAVRGAFRAYRKGGLGAVAKKAMSRFRANRSASYYQDKLSASSDARWRTIRAHIPAGSGSLLDIGSNLGVFTAAASREGMWSVGLEADAAMVRQARERFQGVPNCAFMTSAVDLDTCRKIPPFDVVLLLSVHHHWHFTYGEECADEMLRVLVGGARRAVIFEGPSRTHRYGEVRPDFIDNDEASVTAFYRDFLDRVVGDRVSEIRLIGKAECVGEREPYRWMYALIR